MGFWGSSCAREIGVRPCQTLRFVVGIPPNCMVSSMTGNDLRLARFRLGEMWGLSRPLHCSELGRALHLSPSDPGESIRFYEANRGGEVPGPVAAAVEMMLRGALPSRGIMAILTPAKATSRGRVWVKPAARAMA
jgi:hypothetical protein